jgi:aminoglycoside phosphotransferase (APT) family kinase protein
MFTLTAIREAVVQVCDGSITMVRTIDAGQNQTYQVVFDDETSVILKVGTRFPSVFRAEPAIMRRVKRTTEIPVPEVSAIGDDRLGYPYAIYEFVNGTTYSSMTDMSPAVQQQLCREAGDYLAQLHQIEFAECGGIDCADNTLTVTRPHTYPDALSQSLARQIDLLGRTRFADLCAALESAGDACLATIAVENICPALVHGDYRLDNLCVAPDADRVTQAVLDWERPTAGDPLWDVAMTLALLVDQYGIASDRRSTLRTAFRRGYGEIADDTNRWRCYRLLARIRLARHLSAEMAGQSEPAIETRACEHRTAFANWLDG